MLLQLPFIKTQKNCINANETGFHSHFYANFHASVTLLFVFIFFLFFIFMKFSPKCRAKKLGMIKTVHHFGKSLLIFFIRKGPIFGTKSGLRKPLQMYTIFLYRFAVGIEISFHHSQQKSTGPRSAVGNVSGYRCVSDCRSRGREFDPGPVPYFRGD